MAAGRRPGRRWALFASLTLGFVGFSLSTNPEEIASNASKWVHYAWPDATLPQWIVSPSIDTAGIWITGALALLSFAWFLEQYIPLHDWIRGRSFPFTPRSSSPALSTEKIATDALRKRRTLRWLRIQLGLVCRRVWHMVRLYVPRDYELPYEIRVIGGPEFWNIEHIENDRIAFENRFTDAFPGSRDIVVLSQPRHIIHRLNVLLRWPVVAKRIDRLTNEATLAEPFYWTNGCGNMYIRRYYQYKRNIVLLNEQEIIPLYLAAISGRNYWQKFVYLEGQAMRPKQIPGEMIIKNREFQEFAIYKGRIISRGEYDDGSFLIRGRPQAFEHNPDLRSRKLIGNGFLLIPNSSTVNNLKYDREIKRLISQVISDKKNINDLAQYLLSLPKN